VAYTPFKNRAAISGSEQSQRWGIVDSGAASGNDPSATYATMGAAFADWDRDGDLDLFVAHWQPPRWGRSVQYETNGDQGMCSEGREMLPPPSRTELRSDSTRSLFLENDGAGHFRDVTEAMGVDLWKVSAFTPIFADYDDDGWPDLFLTGDFCTSRLFRNTGGGFADVSTEAGVGTDENGMGSVVEDFNGDGHLDWFVSSISPGPDQVGCTKENLQVGCTGNRLWFGDGSGRFDDVTDEFGVRDAGWAWGAIGEDLDNDGHRDLGVVNGYQSGDADLDPGSPMAAALDFFGDGQPRMWMNGEPSPWIDEAEGFGFSGTGQAKALVAFDHDGDGFLDLLVANSDRGPSFFRNTAKTDGHWLELRSHDATTKNTRAIGARVRVPADDEDPGWVGEMRTGSGYQSSGPGTLHVGLGERDDVELVEVRWPDSDEFKRYDVKSIDTTIVIERSES
jgi:hypothetical protein